MSRGQLDRERDRLVSGRAPVGPDGNHIEHRASIAPLVAEGNPKDMLRHREGRLEEAYVRRADGHGQQVVD